MTSVREDTFSLLFPGLCITDREWHWYRSQTSGQIIDDEHSGGSFSRWNTVNENVCLNLTLQCLHQDGQTCCFVRLVLRFYIERVFSNYASSQPQHQRCSSALANAFFSIRRDIRECVRWITLSNEKKRRFNWKYRYVLLMILCSVQHCNCEEDTQRKIDSVIAEFNKVGMKSISWYTDLHTAVMMKQK